MAITSVFMPGNTGHYFSANPIIMRFNSNAGTNPRIVLNVSTYTDALPPLIADCDSSGNATFNISSLMEKHFMRKAQDEFPTSGMSSPAVLNKSQTPITISADEYNDSPLTYLSTNGFGSVNPNVVWGGVAWDQHYTLDWLNTVQAASHDFLTWNKTPKKTNPNFPEFLTFLFPAGANYTWRLRVKLYYTIAGVPGNTTYTAFTSTVNGVFLMHCIPVGYSALGVAANTPVGATVTHYQVWVEDAAPAAVSAIRTFIIDNSYKRNSRCFVYRNRLGGFDNLMTTGEREFKSELERNNVNRFLPLGYDVIKGQRFSTSINEQQAFKVNTGFKTKYEIDLCRQALISPKICECININALSGTSQAFLPVEITSTSVLVNKDNEFLHALEIEYKYAFKDENFSPQFAPVTQPSGGDYDDDYNDDYFN